MNSVIIYNDDYSNFQDIGNVISLQTTEYYNGIGKMILVLPLEQYYVDMIAIGRLVYRIDSNVAFIICKVKYDTTKNQITVNGFTANSLLNKRTFATSATIATIETDVYAGITSNLRSLSVGVASATGLSESTDVVLYGEELLEAIMPVLEAAELGQRVIWDPTGKTFTFKIYKGTDRSSGAQAVIFSDERGTAKNLIISDDDSEIKNVCYVEGSFNDEAVTVVVSNGPSAGDTNRELFVTASLPTVENETLEDYEMRLSEYGIIELAERTRKTSFSVLIDSSEYGIMYSLGDVVRCVSLRFGMSFTARITAMKQTTSVTGTVTELTLGDAELDMIGVIKLWQR